MTDQTRKFDVVVWGATGFTGRLVAEYLQNNYGTDLSWAVAGRNPDKLAPIVDEIAGSNPPPEMLTADISDAASMTALAESTKAVITTVGPYALYGEPLVEACADAGTHYCDLAGESQWIRRMIDKYQSTAEKTGARIVNSCGFDSIPSDLGTQFLQEQAEQRFGRPAGRVHLLVKAMRGGGSGGTFASMLNIFDEAKKDRNVARIVANPYCLNPDGEREGPDGRDQQWIEFNELADAWTAPFVMAAINTRIVRRSNAVMNYPYGRDFRYGESMLSGSGAGGWLKSVTMSGGIGAGVLAANFGPTRSLIVDKMVPKPGEGPNKEERENGFFVMHLYGDMGDGNVIRARVSGDKDPGYGSTSQMIGESGVCLAKDEDVSGGGLLTPASAMGPILRARLEANAGLKFEVIDDAT